MRAPCIVWSSSAAGSPNSMSKPRRPRGSWQSVSPWYDRSVGDQGQYYHRQLVIPGVLRLLELERTKTPSVLDLGCGQGVLARHLPEGVEYWGVDAASGLIGAALRRERDPRRRYVTADATRPLPVDKKDFSHAAIILALQNVERGDLMIAAAARHLRPGGRLVVALNHPCFRIPRQSSWGVDEANKLRYRRVNRYLGELKVPIAAQPSAGARSPVTWSFHRPLKDYSVWLQAAGFLIERIEEWASDKQSQGRTARMENQSRGEIPLFLALSARLENRQLGQAPLA